jgi:hypothetical protein
MRLPFACPSSRLLRAFHGWCVILWIVLWIAATVTGWIHSVAYVSHLSQAALVLTSWGAWQGARVEDKCWSGVGAAQHGDLVTQCQDLGVLGGVGAGEQCQPAQHANEHQVDESEGHGERSCWAGTGP